MRVLSLPLGKFLSEAVVEFALGCSASQPSCLSHFRQSNAACVSASASFACGSLSDIKYDHGEWHFHSISYNNSMCRGLLCSGADESGQGLSER